MLEKTWQPPYFSSSAANQIPRKTMTMIKAIPKEIHSGDNTHHHDQVMYPVSFNPIKRIVSNPAKPIPPLRVLLLLIVFSFVKRSDLYKPRPIQATPPIQLCSLAGLTS